MEVALGGAVRPDQRDQRPGREEQIAVEDEMENGSWPMTCHDLRSSPERRPQHHHRARPDEVGRRLVRRALPPFAQKARRESVLEPKAVTPMFLELMNILAGIFFTLVSLAVIVYLIAAALS